MKKNGQYVGVDEKYIPEDEKYVDNKTNEEIKDSINNGLRSVNNYVTDKDNQENFKQTGKKGFKVLKGLGIGYLVFIGIVILLVLGIFIFSIVNMVKINNRADDVYEQAGSIIDKVTEQMDDNFNSVQTDDEDSKFDSEMFNNSFELYSGSQSGFFLENLLNEVATNNKTKVEHIITVVYNETMITEPDEITALKQNFEHDKKYEVSLDYDTNGFVNKIIIK